MRGITAEPAIINNPETGRELHRILSGDPAGMTMLAEELGQNYQTTRSQLLDNKSLPVRTVGAGIYVAARLALPTAPLERRWLWPGLRIVLDSGELCPTDNWDSEAGDVTIRSGELHSEVREAIKDGRIDAEEARRIRAKAERTKREADELLALLDRAEARGGSV